MAARLHGIERIVASSAAFAAIDGSGRVVTWGYPMHGGDSSSVAKDCGIPRDTMGYHGRLEDNGDVSGHKWSQELQSSGVLRIVIAVVQDSALRQPMHV